MLYSNSNHNHKNLRKKIAIYGICICNFWAFVNITNAENFDLLATEKNSIVINNFEFTKNENNKNYDENYDENTNAENEVKVKNTYYINADFEFTLPKTLEEALHRGINLHFVAEFNLQKPRKYWFDKHILQKKHSLLLSYHPIQREYRLHSYQVELLGISQTFSNLFDALQVIKRLRRWQVISANDALQNGENYYANFYIYLDNSQLPKPFQISIIGDKTWKLTSDIQKWYFTY